MRSEVRMRSLAFAAALLLAYGCGGGGSNGPSPSAPVVAKASTGSGDAQTGPASQPLPIPLTIIVTRDGNPEASANVAWSTNDGSLNPTAGTTNASGIATSVWTLGANSGSQSAQAAVSGATGSPVAFSATATGGTPPPPAPTEIGITVGNTFFRSARNATTNPAVDTLAVNGTATWTWVNTGTTTHSVQSTGTTHFTSSMDLTGDGQTYQFQFTQAGTYTYNCAVHGNQMTGQIVVR